MILFDWLDFNYMHYSTHILSIHNILFCYFHAMAVCFMLFLKIFSRMKCYMVYIVLRHILFKYKLRTINNFCFLSSSFQFNFVGRILGPRGMTAKQLEQETGCKIMVRGKGSMRDKKKVRTRKPIQFMMKIFIYVSVRDENWLTILSVEKKHWQRTQRLLSFNSISVFCYYYPIQWIKICYYSLSVTGDIFSVQHKSLTSL